MQASLFSEKFKVQRSMFKLTGGHCPPFPLSGGTGFQPVRAQARRLCHHILNNFSMQFFMGLWPTRKL
jgi:hypothetical protein